FGEKLQHRYDLPVLRRLTLRDKTSFRQLYGPTRKPLIPRQVQYVFWLQDLVLKGYCNVVSTQTAVTREALVEGRKGHLAPTFGANGKCLLLLDWLEIPQLKTLPATTTQKTITESQKFLTKGATAGAPIAIQHPFSERPPAHRFDYLSCHLFRTLGLTVFP